MKKITTTSNPTTDQLGLTLAKMTENGSFTILCAGGAPGELDGFALDVRGLLADYPLTGNTADFLPVQFTLDELYRHAEEAGFTLSNLSDHAGVISAEAWGCVRPTLSGVRSVRIYTVANMFSEKH